MYVSPTTTLASLVATSVWWVEITVPKDQLRWLEPDATARIFDEAAWGPDVFREARVLQVGSEVVEGGRMVKVFIAVDDPLSIEDAKVPRMLLGSWARVQIDGRQVAAVELDRQMLRDGDAVWVMSQANKLEVRPVVIGARHRTSVLVVEGLKDGDRVISSALQPVPGMQLRVRDGGAAEARRQ